MLGEAATAVGLVALVEAGLAGLIHGLKRDCPWLITARDLNPRIDREGLERFIEHGWDADLGWVRKPNTSRSETGAQGTATHYHIDKTGARADPEFPTRPLAAIACGDSYTFCRQVNDDETWPYFLSRALGGKVRNVGVGNYGMDQALLRLEREFSLHPAPITIMGVVPETICRVQSVWKHFSEYGNIFAFKPRFRLLQGGDLELIPNPIRMPEDFFRIETFLSDLKRDDEFYRRKFSDDLLRLPYLYHMIRTRHRTPALIAAALTDRIDGGMRAFTRVMKKNIEISAELYRDSKSRALLTAIIRRFAGTCKEHHTRPVLLFIPQLLDLELLRASDHFYTKFLEEAEPHVDVVDMGPALAAANADAELYIDDRFGGHLSARGNRLVAEKLALLLDKRSISADVLT